MTLDTCSGKDKLSVPRSRKGRPNVKLKPRSASSADASHSCDEVAAPCLDKSKQVRKSRKLKGKGRRKANPNRQKRSRQIRIVRRKIAALHVARGRVAVKAVWLAHDRELLETGHRHVSTARRHMCAERKAAEAMDRAWRRAEAITRCGRTGIAMGAGGSLLRDAAGLPVSRRQSCNDRWCWDCVKRRATRLSTEYDAVISALLKDERISDGRLRQVVLHGPTSSDAVLAERVKGLWECFSRLRAENPHFQHAIACLEIKYNFESDWFHPHLHVMVVTSHDVARVVRRSDSGALVGGALVQWQRILNESNVEGWHGRVRVDGGVGKGSAGGCYVNEKRNVKEAIKYITKGLGDDLVRMPETRALELMEVLEGLRTLRSMGDVKLVADDLDVTPTLVDAIDAMLIDSETGHAYAATEAAAKLLGCPLASWSWSASTREMARELAYVVWRAAHDKDGKPLPVDEETAARWERGRLRRLRRARAKRWQERKGRIRRQAERLRKVKRWASDGTRIPLWELVAGV